MKLLEDIRKVVPEYSKQLDDAFNDLLPTKGQVRSPNGLVHAVIGDHTYCDIQWAAYSRKEGRTLKVVSWEPCEDAVTCLECLVES